MPDSGSQIRRQTRVRWSDDDFTVRALSIENLLQIQREDVAHGWSRRWSSEAEMLRQVSPDGQMFLCPHFRNGGPADLPESYRCWFWFTLGEESSSKGLTLLDVGKALYEDLPEIGTAGELKQIISIMLGGMTEGVSFESIL